MKPARIQSMTPRILAFAAASLFSTMALAVSLTWQFGGQANDGTPFSASMAFDSTQLPSNTITSTIVTEIISDDIVITATLPVLTEFFTFSGLSFNLGEDDQGSTTAGAIIQRDVLGQSTFTDTYTIEAIFDSAQNGVITRTLTMGFAGPDLFNSLLTDVNVLQGTLPGTFELFGTSVGPGPITSTFVVAGTIESLSNLTAIPEPWTLGLMLSGLGSIGFLSLAALRSRRNRL